MFVFVLMCLKWPTNLHVAAVKLVRGSDANPVLIANCKYDQSS